MVPIPTSLSDYRDEEHIINLSQFGILDKVYFFIKSSEIICDEVVKDTKTEKRLKESMNKFGELLKEEKGQLGPNRSQ